MTESESKVLLHDSFAWSCTIPCSRDHTSLHKKLFEGGPSVKKQSDLSRLMGYAGNYRRFTYVSWALSAVSALVPFVYIWKILRDVLNAAPDYAQAVNIPRYGCDGGFSNQPWKSS